MLEHTIGAITVLDPATAPTHAAATVLFAGDHAVAGPVGLAGTGRLVGGLLDLANRVTVVDVGLADPVEPRPGLVDRRIRAGTRDFTAEPALTADEVRTAVEIGIGAADNAVDDGAGRLAAGAVGDTGTAAAVAVIAVLAHLPADGIRPDLPPRLRAAVRHGLTRHHPDPADPLAVLAAVGGLEHAALTGFILAAAAHHVPVMIDDVVGESAAVAAAVLAPPSRSWVFGRPVPRLRTGLPMSPW